MAKNNVKFKNTTHFKKNILFFSPAKGNHLWQFLWELLQNPEHKDIVRWENKQQKIFKLLNSRRVAQLWGIRKRNPEMTYDKMSRGIR